MESPNERQQISPDGRWLACSESNYVLLVDLEYKNTAWEQGYRTAKARFDPNWHRVRAKEAEAVEDWYAATFHFALLMENDPDQALFYDDLQSSFQKLAKQYEKDDLDVESFLASTTKRALSLSVQIAKKRESEQHKLPATVPPIDVSTITYSEPGSDVVFGKFFHTEGKTWREENGHGVFDFQEQSRTANQLILRRNGLDLVIDFQSKQIIWRDRHTYDVVSISNSEESSGDGDSATGNVHPDSATGGL